MKLTTRSAIAAVSLASMLANATPLLAQAACDFERTAWNQSVAIALDRMQQFDAALASYRQAELAHIQALIDWIDAIRAVGNANTPAQRNAANNQRNAAIIAVTNAGFLVSQRWTTLNEKRTNMVNTANNLRPARNALNACLQQQ